MTLPPLFSPRGATTVPATRATTRECARPAVPATRTSLRDCARPDLDVYALQLEATLRSRAALGPRPMTTVQTKEEGPPPTTLRPTTPRSTLPQAPAGGVSISDRHHFRFADSLREETFVYDRRGNETLGFPYGLWGEPSTKLTGFDESPRRSKATSSPRSKPAASASAIAGAIDARPSTGSRQGSGADAGLLAAAASPTAAAASMGEVCLDFSSHAAGFVRLTSAAAIYDALRPRANGKQLPSRLVRGTWLLERAEAMRGAQALSQNTEASCAYRRFMMNELALPRRQELPEEAFISGQEVTELQVSGTELCACATEHCH